MSGTRFIKLVQDVRRLGVARKTGHIMLVIGENDALEQITATDNHGEVLVLVSGEYVDISRSAGKGVGNER